MAKDDLSDSETNENSENTSSEEVEKSSNGGTQKVSEYEKQRLLRIEQNRARLEALGLPKMASSLMGSTPKQTKYKGKGKKVEDEEYRPPDGLDVSTSSTQEDGFESTDNESSGSRLRKVKKKSKPKKKVSVQKLLSNSDFIENDDDDALMQAIALSLKDSAEISDVVYSGPSQSSDACVVDNILNERKGNAHIQEDTGRRKRKKSISSRVQMTEDELVVHFFHFDEAGQGSITLRDIRRVATAHDFTWTDKEMADMIRCFDSDGDGKLTLDDFRKIAGRCNMIQGSENVVMRSKP